MKYIHMRIGFLLGLLLLLSSMSRAESDPQETLRREFDSALQGLVEAKQKGPADFPFLDQAVLHLPEGFAFVPNPAAQRFMNAMGNRVNDSFIGLILPEDKEADWIISVSFEKSGYIKDDDAKNWNVDDMYKHLQESAQEMNKVRAERGIPGLKVMAWAERPDYDPASHRLVWSLAVSNEGASADEPQSVNYNTYALGRDGFFSLNLVTTLDDIENRKPMAKTLLSSLDFNPGKRYEEFNAETDHTAEFGLAALVGGALAAKKLG
ncbi:MAG: DUF2167 domain-containing protein, partial [Methylococcaceae bacterium]|nr:DUF2167 domain-containing protein [Methylococcaceae bacterium]